MPDQQIPSTPKDTHTCPKCGHTENAGLMECANCGHSLYERAPETPDRRIHYVIQALLFVVVLGMVAYPYLKRSFPALEGWVEPAVKHMKQGDRFFKEYMWREALIAYKRASKKRGLMTYLFAAAYKRRTSLMHYKMSICSLRMRQLPQAIQYARTSIKLTPQWILPYEVLLRLHSFQQDLPGFRRTAQMTGKRFPRQWRVWMMIGRGYSELHANKEAVAAYEAGRRLRPKHPQLLNNLAWALLEQKKVTQAQKERALKLAKEATKRTHSNDFTTLATLAKAQASLKQYKEARQHLKKAIKLAKETQTRHKNSLDPHRQQMTTQAIEKMSQNLILLNRILSPTPVPSVPPTPAPTSRPQPTPMAATPATSRPTTRPLVRLLPMLPRRRIILPKATPHKRSHQLLLPQ